MTKTQFDNYTSVVSLWNELGIRTRDPISKTPSYFKVAYKPTTYTRCSAQYATGSWKTLKGEHLRVLQHKSLQDYREYVAKAEHQNQEIFGTINPINQFIAENVSENCGVEFSSLRTFFIDIEVDSKGGFATSEYPVKPIIAISVEVWGQYLVWGTGKYTPTEPNVTYNECSDEIDLLNSFCKWWTTDYPDIVSGWNVQFYDIPYIVNRINLLNQQGELTFDSKILSPWGRISSRNAIINGQSSLVIDILGVNILDYLELYRKFSLTQQESYRLDYIAEVELKENKVSYDEYGSLQDLAENDFQKFIDYNIHDTRLVKMLNDKMHHIDLCVKIAYNSRVNFADPFKQVRLWDAIIYYDLHKKNIAIPTKKVFQKSLEFAGAYVKDPIIGKHSWIASFDVNSLYPSIMREWNISEDRHLPLSFLKQRLFEIEQAHPFANSTEPTTFTSVEWLTNVSSADAPTVIWALSNLLDSLKTMDIESLLLALDKDNPFPWLTVLNVAITPNQQVYRSDSNGFLPAILAKMYDSRKKAKNKQLRVSKDIEEINAILKFRGVDITK